eukprot:8955258-Lingulodinium_polyedra.AAC.1
MGDREGDLDGCAVSAKHSKGVGDAVELPRTQKKRVQTPWHSGTSGSKADTQALCMPAWGGGGA